MGNRVHWALKRLLRTSWESGVKPVLLGQDDQIKSLAKKGKLAMKDAHIVLNAPILKVGKGG